MGARKYDFCGWATKNDLKCSDGLVIRRDAFKAQDGQTVPLVFRHQHDSMDNVLGHAVLENRDEGVYMYGYFNDSKEGRAAKERVQHGDITQLSIYANQLQKRSNDVMHGMIREVSLVLAGANPGARIEHVTLQHSDGSWEDLEDEFVLFPGLYLEHEDEEDKEDKEETNESDKKVDPKKIYDSMTKEQKDLVHYMVGIAAKGGVDEDEAEHEYSDDDYLEQEDDPDFDPKAIYESMNDEQKALLHYLVGEASKGNYDEEEAEHEDYDYDDDYLEQEDEGGDAMKANVFEQYGENRTGATSGVLTAEQCETIFHDAMKGGSLKDAFLAHTDEYGIEDIEYLFPDAKNLDNPPSWIKRDTGWVSVVMGGVHHTPFSRIKSMHANITADEARAKGYVKGNRKIEEVFPVLTRTTEPQTIYKKQKLDKDDITDITDFNVVSWIKAEMRVMLDEEIARAILISDGRSVVDNTDKIKEDKIRPIWKDDELYTINTVVEITEEDDEDARASKFIRKCIKDRKYYKGSGNPIMFTTEDMLTNMLLLTDLNGRDIYDSVEKLATKLRVSKIVTVPVMENQTRQVTIDHEVHDRTLAAIIVNLSDYNVGADKGGAISMFEDFDIDFNQEKYLIETRCSGALTVPYSAMAVEFEVVAAG